MLVKWWWDATYINPDNVPQIKPLIYIKTQDTAVLRVRLIGKANKLDNAVNLMKNIFSNTSNTASNRHVFLWCI